jgi:hypothetical protein
MKKLLIGPLVLLLCEMLLPAALDAQDVQKELESAPIPVVTNNFVTVICDPGIRLIVDGEFAGITQSQTNTITLKTTTNSSHRIIMQKPDRIGSGGLYRCVPQSFIFTLEPGQKKDVVAAPFVECYIAFPAQKPSPGEKKFPDCGFASLIVECNPEECALEFRSETIQLPPNKYTSARSINDVCEGRYLLVFHHKDQTLSTNVSFRPHQVVTLEPDFVESRVRDRGEERARYHERIRSLIKEMRSNGFADFQSLPEGEKDSVVWMLYEDKEWGHPDQKLICQDLLSAQGYTFANAVAWTTGAIDLTEAQGWKDLSPLISSIYERPKNWWVYERAFRYLRAQAGKPVSANIIADAQTLSAAGYYQTNVTDKQLSEVKKRLLKEPDKEAVLVYCIGQASTFGGKYSGDRGGLAAIDILKQLDQETVAKRVHQLLRDHDDVSGHGFEWTAEHLGMDLKTISAPIQQ